MIYKYHIGLFIKALNPCQKAVHVGVAAYSVKRMNFGFYGYVFAKKTNFACTFDKPAAERSLRLITGKYNRVARVPEIVLKMVTYTAGIAHSACGDNYLGL